MKGRPILISVLTLGLLLALAAGLALAQGPDPQGSAARMQGSTPTTVSYQGRVTVEGEPFHGTGYFKFAIVDSHGNVTWSNDGTGGGGEPTGSVALLVTEGLFNVALGDEGLGMVPLTDIVFADARSALRVWFSADGEGYTQLVPDRPLATVPYAFIAEQSNLAFDADTVDGQHASAFAAANHGHWDQYWSGSGIGLIVDSSDNIGLEGISAGRYIQTIFGETSSPGLLGTASATSGKAVGVHGRALNSPGGIGVYGTAQLTGTVGIASATSGNARGVYGESASPQGAGVYGKDKATSGGGAGVAGESDSPSGAGVAGYGDHSSGENYGVYGQSASSAGKGVYGLANASSGVTYGVYGKAPSLSGRGVYGEGGYYGVYGVGTDPSGIAHGVYGETRSPSYQASGVFGQAQASQGTVYGVRGQSTASDAGTGVYGEGSVAGVRGHGTGGSTYGVLGEVGSAQGIGVYGTGSVTGTVGIATQASGTTYGVYGRSESASGYGVYSAGNAHVEGNLTWKAQTSYLSIPPAAVVPRDNDMPYYNLGYVVSWPGFCLPPTRFVAPVMLPHGAVVTKLTVYIWAERLLGASYPPDYPHPLVVRFLRTDFEDGQDEVAVLQSGDVPADVFWHFDTTSISYATVDNAGHTYYLEIAMCGDDALDFRGAVIEYQISGPY